VLLLLFILLFLVGGGIGMILFALPTWAVSTRINRQLAWWRRVLRGGLLWGLARLWPVFVVASTVLLLAGQAIALTGFIPGLSDPERILSIDWSVLGAGLALFLLAFVAGFARDIEANPMGQQDGRT
jgi:hypothetical protein